MADTIFVPGTVVASTWLNDVNSAIYKAASAITGAVNRTAVSKLADTISVKDFGATGDGVTNDTTAIQTALSSLTTGKTLYFPAGTYIVTVMLVLNASNCTVLLDAGATLSYNTPNYAALQINGTYCNVLGGLSGGFLGTGACAAWDGINVQPSYGVIWITGNNCTVSTRLVNVRKVGLWFKDVEDGTAKDCVIEANYPSAQWTGVETVNFGIQFDPSAGSSGGNFKAQGNTIKQAVQGIFAGNYGSGGVTRGLNITGNLMENCWNHGVYTASANGAVIDGNTFNRCELPVASTGSYNVISNNTMTTAQPTAGDMRDVVGIQVRDSRGSIIVGNTIKGVVIPASAVVIDVINLDTTTTMDRNVVSNNTIEITDGTVSAAIRIEGSTVRASGNIVSNNTITAIGNTSNGLIAVGGAAGSTSNRVYDNLLFVLGGLFGITLSNQQGTEVHHNTVELLYDAGAAVNYVIVGFDNTKLSLAESNAAVCGSIWGTNITIYGYREFNTCSTNRVKNNCDFTDKTKLVAYINVQPVNNSLMELDDVGVGVPAMHARIGSSWRRSDGGVGTTLYIKQANTDGTGWAAK